MKTKIVEILNLLDILNTRHEEIIFPTSFANNTFYRSLGECNTILSAYTK